MDKNEAKRRIDALRQEINAHNRHYYLENSPTISDYEFDLLLKELIQLEELYPEFKSPDSPTSRVGSDLETENAPLPSMPTSTLCSLLQILTALRSSAISMPG